MAAMAAFAFSSVRAGKITSRASTRELERGVKANATVRSSNEYPAALLGGDVLSSPIRLHNRYYGPVSIQWQ